MLNFNQQLAQNGNSPTSCCMAESQDSLLSSSNMFLSPSVDVTMLQPESSFLDNQALNSLRILQNRQLGVFNYSGRQGFGFPIGAPATMQLSTSAPISSAAVDECVSLDYGSGISVRARRLSEQLCGTAELKKSNTIKMDLDSALDELGMLSTVTNSRRQFLLEQQQKSLGNSSSSISNWFSQGKRLRSKSESSPNLTALANQSSIETVSPANGYHIVKINTDFVTGFSNPIGQHPGYSKPGMYNQFDEDSDGLSILSNPSRSQYRNPDLLEQSGRRRLSIPRMSRFRKDKYRRSRCPYAIPNRLSCSMQESDFSSEYFDACPSPFLVSIPQTTSTDESLTDHLNKSLDLPSSSDGSAHQLPKSDTTSPVKPICQELRLTRSLSAENLGVRKRLEQELSGETVQLPLRERSSTERGLDLMTSQMTNLHMT
ncbi:hypothetical protein PoB_001768000 [Plakobranchus ocellatus]|uniref:Uncharacterized protein n=1 Tax=Plakobranchus ocellatus TaxID=259542 RepID=A0AAV3Z6R3_9GAST|nr:hypothetical protein PoB_001768000 [Plakobranchus ocellatus]